MNGSPLSRRRVLQGLSATAAFAAMSGHFGTAWATQTLKREAGLLGVGSRPDPTKPVGADLMPQVENIVIYMQENRSFDHYFGLLKRSDGQLVDGFTIGAGGLPANSNPDLEGNPVALSHSAEFCDNSAGTSQSWNSSHISYDGGAMDGFVRAGGGATGAMTYWAGQDLPFYNGLADTFPICDRWFCSVLGQTFPNRRYLQAATSVGIVSTDVNEVLATPDAPNGLIWDRLNDLGITWKDYAIDLVDILLFPNFYNANKSHIFGFADFLADAAAGTLPQVSIISPGGKAYSEENPNDIQLGEAYSASIVNALLQSPQWPRTAMFFMYDEHGGYYDHVAPPAAVAPDSIAPRITVPPDQPGAFDRYGMRVPGFVISPFAKRNYVSHVVHDHTSVLKFIETKWNLESLTNRDAAADDLLDAFDFDRPGFMHPPELPPPGIPASGSTCSDVALPPQPLPTTTTTTTTTAPTTSTMSPLTTPSTPPGASPRHSGGSTPAGLDLFAASVSTSQAANPVRHGSATGDGVPTGTLATTGSPIDALSRVGGFAALGGIAAVLAAREKSRRTNDAVEDQ